MKTLFESKTILISIDEQTPCLEWISKGGFTTSEEFRQSEHKSLEFFRIYKKEFPDLEWFVDATKLGVITQKDIDWVTEIILPEFSKLGLTKEAFVLPENIFGEVAVKAYEQKNKNGVVNIQYFGNADLAKTWLKNKL